MRAKTVFFCTECGNESLKWQGRCTACGSWNTLVEQPSESKRRDDTARAVKNAPQKLSELADTAEIRFATGLNEFDRVLGGGAVEGSLVLICGAPGIGKSTLLLQICRLLGGQKVLYVTGEESGRQLKMRANRLDALRENIYVLAETDIDEILGGVDSVKPNILIIDSIQTLYSADINSPPGSVTQVKECAMSLLRFSKSSSVTVFMIGHVNKEGAIAGPKVLEHMVDCVLYFEGERSMNYRILRAVKNRFGSTNEIGVFEMLPEGLTQVPNPSETLLAGKPKNTPGTCVTCVMEGVRPILAEIQALIAPSSLNIPRRNANGIDYNRAMMLLTVLEKRGGIRISGCDAYINVIGGLTLDEPGCDLATVLAAASCYRDKPVGDDVVAIGEIGLTGELRAVTQMNARLQEIRRLGFTKCVIPKSKSKLILPDGLTVIYAATINDALKALAI